MTEAAMDGGVMLRLKSGTQDLHAHAESRRFQRRMLQGDLSREEYGDWLAQMLHIHRALESALRPRLAADPLFAAVRPGQFQEQNLRDDLAALGRDAEATAPLPACAEATADVARCAVEQPLALLGFHYVLEGSKNGNRFIARRLIPALGLVAGRADRYLDPHADDQPALWAQFKRDMAGLPLDDAQVDVLVAAARRMFEQIGRLSDELLASSSLPS